MNLVVGATGCLGSEICARLLERHKPVRAMVRASSSAAAVARLRRAGVEIVVGDLMARDSLPPACTGIRTVVSAVGTPRGQLALIDAAQQAGASELVFVSLAALVNGGSPLQREAQAVERHLHESGLAYTILRPAFFMDTWLSPVTGFDLRARRVKLYGSGDEQVTWITIGDVADVAVACLSASMDCNALELCSPDRLSPREIVGLAEQIGGRPIEVERIPLDVLEQGRDGTFDSLLIHLARGGTMQPARLPAHLPQPRTHVRHYLRTAL